MATCLLGTLASITALIASSFAAEYAAFGTCQRNLGLRSHSVHCQDSTPTRPVVANDNMDIAAAVVASIDRLSRSAIMAATDRSNLDAVIS